jgi:uncharacterized protein YbaR (Trm112 family)/SAM-dependent methyltransferase
MSLIDILACPNCKIHVIQQVDSLKCEKCGISFPIINSVPVMFPDGSVPVIQHEADLQIHRSYNPWVHRIILQSLLDNQIVVEIGAGNIAFDDPCIIRMDVTLSPYVDLVADAHYMPFLPESLDFVFSLAVFEHLRNPFQAAQSIYEVLKDGGYIYNECNFVFAYHGYPYHYFNASLQGMEQIFSDFVALRKGVATYQMPSFALNMILGTYLNYSHANEYLHGQRLTLLIRKILELNLMDYDIYFSENEALYVAAGTYFSGIKKKTRDSTLMPMVIQRVWKDHSEINSRFHDINQIGYLENILIWANREGRKNFPEISEYLDNIIPFNKRGIEAPSRREEIRAFELEEAKFGAIGFNPDNSMEINSRIAEIQYQERKKKARGNILVSFRRVLSQFRHEGGRAALRELLWGIIERL